MEHCKSILFDNCGCKNFAGYISFTIAISVFISISDLQSSVAH